VLGGGLAFRGIARQGLSMLPGFGWAIKGGIAYSGTIAMGKSAIAYFEEGADVREVALKLVQRGEELAAEAKIAASRRVPARGITGDD